MDRGPRGADAEACPAAGTNKTSPPSIASRTAENRPPAMRGMHQSGEQSRARLTGQDGQGSAKQAVPPTAPSARTLSAYLHRRGDASGSAVARIYGLRACFTVPPCPDCCRFLRAGGRVRGAKRPRSGAEGALDTAARERIMAGGGKGANLRRDRRFRVCWRGAFLAGIGVTCSMTGRGRRGDSQAYLGPRARAAPGDMMIDWVSSRLRGDAAAQSIQAVRLALRGRTGSG